MVTVVSVCTVANSCQDLRPQLHLKVSAAGEKIPSAFKNLIITCFKEIEFVSAKLVINSKKIKNLLEQIVLF
jgi:hypothetical protein